MTSQESQQISQNNRDHSTGNQAVVKHGGTAFVGTNTITNNVYNNQNSEKPTLASPKSILLLSANPKNPEGWTRSKENLAEIEKALDKATMYRLKEGKTSPAFASLRDELRAGAGEVAQTLSAMKPYIIDIFGFEDGLSNLALEESFQTNQGKDPEFLIGEMFRISSPTTKCMVLNGCYLEKQAREIVQHVDYLIGINQLISTDATLLFLNEFYFRVGSGEPVSNAYEAGRNRVLRSFDDNAQVPILLTKIEEISRRDEEQKLRIVTKEIEEVPNSVEKRTEKGDLLEKSGKHERAASAYREALYIDGKNYKVWWKYGIAQAKAGDYAKAKEAYNNALSLNQSFSDEYIIRREHGSLLEKMNELENSLASYKSSLWLEPRYRVASYEKRKIYKNLYFKAR